MQSNLRVASANSAIRWSSNIYRWLYCACHQHIPALWISSPIIIVTKGGYSWMDKYCYAQTSHTYKEDLVLTFFVTHGCSLSICGIATIYYKFWELKSGCRSFTEHIILRTELDRENFSYRLSNGTLPSQAFINHCMQSQHMHWAVMNVIVTFASLTVVLRICRSELSPEIDRKCLDDTIWFGHLFTQNMIVPFWRQCYEQRQYLKDCKMESAS